MNMSLAGLVLPHGLILMQQSYACFSNKHFLSAEKDWKELTSLAIEILC